MFVLRKGDLEERWDCYYNLAIKKGNPKTTFPTKSLYKLITSFSGGTPSKSVLEYWQGETCWASPKDFKEFYISETEDHISSEAINNSATKLVPTNSVLVVVRSGILQHSLPVAVTTKPMAINQDLKALVPKHNDLLPEYLGYYLNVFSKQLLPLITKHSTTVQSINTDQFEKLLIPLPTLEIQQQIIEKMNSAYTSKKIKEVEANQLLASIDSYLLGELGFDLPPVADQNTFILSSLQLMGSRFDPFYHKKYYKKLKENLLNGKYEVIKLKELINEIHYGASVSNDYVESGIPLLRIKDLRRNRIEISEVAYLPETMRGKLNNCFVKKNDFLISRSGSLGIVAIVPEEIEGFAFGSFMIKFNLNHSIAVNKFYLSFFLNSIYTINIIEKEKIGAIQGNITIPTIKALDIPLPPLPKQIEIAEQIEAILTKAKILKNEGQKELDNARQETIKIILGDEQD